MFIYLIVNHVTGKYYVGQTKSPNLEQYLQQKFYAARKHLGGQSRLYRSIRKHGREAFTIHALLSDIQTREELNQKERDFIEFLRSRDPEYGYNICRGGEGFTGVGWWKGKKFSEEHKANLRKNHVGMTGHKKSPESIAKTVAFLTGRKRSEETCKKISESKMGKPWSVARREVFNNTPQETRVSRAKKHSDTLRGRPWSETRKIAEAQKTYHGWVGNSENQKLGSKMAAQMRAANHSVTFSCKECMKQVRRALSAVRKTKNSFCSQSCANKFRCRKGT